MITVDGSAYYLINILGFCTMQPIYIKKDRNSIKSEGKFNSLLTVGKRAEKGEGDEWESRAQASRLWF